MQLAPWRNSDPTSLCRRSHRLGGCSAGREKGHGAYPDQRPGAASGGREPASPNSQQALHASAWARASTSRSDTIRALSTNRDARRQPAVRVSGNGASLAITYHSRMIRHTAPPPTRYPKSRSRSPYSARTRRRKARSGPPLWSRSPRRCARRDCCSRCKERISGACSSS